MLRSALVFLVVAVVCGVLAKDAGTHRMPSLLLIASVVCLALMAGCIGTHLLSRRGPVNEE
jgi:biotin transporter BioY